MPFSPSINILKRLPHARHCVKYYKRTKEGNDFALKAIYKWLLPSAVGISTVTEEDTMQWPCSGTVTSEQVNLPLWDPAPSSVGWGC